MWIKVFPDKPYTKKSSRKQEMGKRQKEIVEIIGIAVVKTWKRFNI